MRSFEDSIIECSTDEKTERLDHFRKMKYVLDNLDEYPRVPNHQESVAELKKINNFLFYDNSSTGIIDLTEVTKEQKIKEQQLAAEAISIGEQLYEYCRKFESSDMSVIDRQKHCEVLMSFLALKQESIRRMYLNERSGSLENHEQLVELEQEIIAQKDQINTFMATTK